MQNNVEFEPTTCWAQLDEPAATECGWLVVPEDWNAPEGKQLKLPVVVYRAIDPDPSLSPIVYLAGGPGGFPLGHNGKYMNGWRREADFSFPGRTLIVFDQRGTGLGSPTLGCPEVEDPLVWWPISKNTDEQVNPPERVHREFKECLVRHVTEGRQLSAFNTIQSATDVEAMRHALQLKHMILYGLSYGTRLALTVMKLYPEGVEAAILDSVYPPQAEITWNDAGALGPVFDRLFEACNQHSDCSTAYPDLRARFLRAIEQLRVTPAIVEITNLEGGEVLYAHVDHRMFLEILRSEMYFISRLPNIPMLISGVAQGEYWRLRQHIENTVYGYFPGSYTMGASLAVTCNDDASLIDRPVGAGLSEKYPYLTDYVQWGREYQDCGFWPIDPDTRNRDPVVSGIPTLLLAGGLDPATTLEHAEMAAETLEIAHLFKFPAYGHVQLRSNPCAWEVLNEFLSEPKRRPDPDCLKSPRQPAFITVGGN